MSSIMPRDFDASASAEKARAKADYEYENDPEWEFARNMGWSRAYVEAMEAAGPPVRVTYIKVTCTDCGKWHTCKAVI